ncbi:MAG: hypothetical protein EA397_05275 [Deltaproteobacteria bacterium]|nr:MAG: hypothetical protein EA397_05275 [Deltaproteobacteria bacterium]
MAGRATKSLSVGLAVAVGLVLLVGGTLTLLSNLEVDAWVSEGSPAPELKVTYTRGQVEISDGSGRRQPARQGERVAREDRISTAAGAEAILSAGEDIELRLDGATGITVREIHRDGVEVELADGQVRAEVRAGDRSLRVSNDGRAVQTREGAVRIAMRDGLFAAELERGSATAEGLGGISVLSAGERALAWPDGTATLGPIPDEVVLDVAWPEGGRTRAPSILAKGVTVAGATVSLQLGDKTFQVQADPRGRFEIELPLTEGQQVVVVEAVDPFGELVTDSVRLERDTRPPPLRGGVESTP